MKLESNPEILAVNQQGMNPKLVYEQNSSSVWISKFPNSKDVYVAIYNLRESALPVPVSFQSLSIKGKIIVRDLWEHKDVGIFTNNYSPTIDPHGSMLIRFSIKNKLHN